MIKHHVTSLKVAVKEAFHFWYRVLRIVGQVLCQKTEICLQLQFMEIKFGSFQETILEIIEVKKHAVLVKLCLWIAIREIQFTGTSDLYIRQFTDGTLQQFLFL